MDATTIEKRLAALKAELATVQGTPTEVYSRIVGYYRSVKNWNAGKREEFAHRVTFQMPSAVPTALDDFSTPPVDYGENRPAAPESRGMPTSYVLFTRKACPNCPPVREYLAHTGLPGTEWEVDTPKGFELACGFGVLASPTAILLTEGGEEVYRACTVPELKTYFAPVSALR